MKDNWLFTLIVVTFALFVAYNEGQNSTFDNNITPRVSLNYNRFMQNCGDESLIKHQNGDRVTLLAQDYAQCLNDRLTKH